MRAAVNKRRFAVTASAAALLSLVIAASAQADWQEQGTAPLSPGTSSSFSAVSCTSGGFCMAVGTFTSGGNSGLLGESRSGTTWTFQTPPNVTGNNTEKLNGISCASASSCVAVGSYFDGVNTVPLAEIWNGSAWSVANPLTPSGASDSEIFGVSCKSSSSCMAVGSSDHAYLKLFL
jgi:opacity protein-like surface antigen